LVGFIRGGLPLMVAAALQGTPGVEGQAMSYAMQPTAHAFVFGQSTRLPGKHHKRRLECIFGVLKLAEHAPASRQHQRPIAVDEDGKGVLIPAPDEGAKQLAVPLAPPMFLGGHAANVAHYLVKPGLGHG
jgi:hypothetical protein